MIVLDENMNEISEPDLDAGWLEEHSIGVSHRYIVDVEEVAHEEVVAEYPNGGKDVEYVVDIEEQGHWETRDRDGNLIDIGVIVPDDAPKEQTISDTYQFFIYKPYTPDELLAFEKQKQQAEAREAFLADAPVIQAEQDAAITDLYEMILEVQNG